MIGTDLDRPIASELAVVLNSYGRCLLHDRFFHRLGQLLHGAPASEQVDRLREELNLTLVFSPPGSPARRPSSRFIDSLLATVAECDPKFDPQIAAGWRQLLRG